MATKTFEELKQLAIQIRDEKTNKQNTATRIGTQMLEHLEKLEQDYYDKTTINNRTIEYNVSINHPTSGISGGNKYDLTSAIGQVPAELRHAGLKVTFLNEEGTTETWEFQGGTFTSVASWKKRDAVTIVQELGDGENAVMSQKAVSETIDTMDANIAYSLPFINDEYEEKLTNINDIQKQLDIAMRDTSLQGQKKVQELQKLLADAQKELDKFTQDKIDSDVNDAFDKEISNIEETNKSAIEALEKEWSESKIAEMVSQAISTGIFEGIDGKVSGLQDAMLEFAQETGELFGVMGTVIKSELITNLDIAMDTFRDLGNIIKNLDLEKFSTLPRGFNVNMRSMPSVASSSSSLVLNAPMIHIEGNADKDVIEDLKSFGDKIVNDVINKISSSIR